MFTNDNLQFMYITRPVECSKCNALNQYEDYSKTTGSVLTESTTEHIRKCKKCGHESVTGTTTTSVFGDSPTNFYVLDLPPTDKF